MKRVRREPWIPIAVNLFVMGSALALVANAELPFDACWTTAATVQGTYVTHELLLEDGRLLIKVNGGVGEGYTLYDPDANTWTPVPDPPVQPVNFVWCLSDGGRVFIAEYVFHSKKYYALLYDSVSNIWTRCKDLPSDLHMPVVHLRPDGTLFLQSVKEADRKSYTYDLDADAYTEVAVGHFDLDPEYLRLPRLKAFHLPGAGAVKVFDPEAYSLVHLDSVTHSLNYSAQKVLAEIRVYVREKDYNNGAIIVHAVDLYDGGNDEFLSLGATTDERGLSVIGASGREYVVYWSASTNGDVTARLFDWNTSAWVDLSATNMTGTIKKSLNLDKGFLLWSQDGSDIRFLKLAVTNEVPMPAQIADDLPASVSLNEGSEMQIRYHIVGAIPTNGVNVICERSSGDGDARVIGGATHSLHSLSEISVMSVAALTDADSLDDTATLRLRVVQDGGGMDPHARTIALTIVDQVEEASHMPGDVNTDGVVNALDLDEVIDHFGQQSGQ